MKRSVQVLIFYAVLCTALKPSYRGLVEKYNDTSYSTDFLLQIITVESGGDPNAVSPVGAKGLFQLMPVAVKEARSVCPELPAGLDLHDPEDNVRTAMCYIKGIQRYTNNIREFLAFYNGGGRARDAVREGKRIPFRETRNYLKKFGY